MHTFLTDTNDMFIHTETKESKNQIFHINLDNENPIVNGPIF